VYWREKSKTESESEKSKTLVEREAKEKDIVDESVAGEETKRKTAIPHSAAIRSCPTPFGIHGIALDIVQYPILSNSIHRWHSSGHLNAIRSGYKRVLLTFSASFGSFWEKLSFSSIFHMRPLCRLGLPIECLTGSVDV